MNKSYTLILPVAGKSSRFPGMRPKWLLTMPDGKLMIEKSIELFDISRFDKIIIVCLKEHVDKYLSEDYIANVKNKLNHPNILFCMLDEPTKSQSETVAKALILENISGAFLIKDCDNVFSFDWSGGNQIATVNLNDADNIINIKNKSYVSVDTLGNIINIVEKRIISDTFCCGAYGFESAEEFLHFFNEISREDEVYISHVVFAMIMRSSSFKIGYAKNYMDWGTEREYINYMRSFVTIFCDIDGVLLENGSKFGPNKWATKAIQSNVSSLAELQKKGIIHLIVTSSRPEEQENYIRSVLSEYGVVADRYILGLPHGRRMLVNDYSTTNPYPTAIALNLERNSENLKMLINSVFN